MKKHIYLIPGTAASSNIFDRIKFPKDEFEIHFIDWLIPVSLNESIEAYSMRLSKQIYHQNPIIIGVSFGGIIAQEISKILPSKEIVIISSIKNKYELSKILYFVKISRLYLLVTPKLINLTEKILSFTFGNRTKKQIEVYRNYLPYRNSIYLRWAVKQALFWKQKISIPGIIHLHGTNDFVFPIRNIKACLKIENGSHAMILTKGKKISSILLNKFK
jgi:pimeloyl-ACP methyl ester carboxylesterase